MAAIRRNARNKRSNPRRMAVLNASQSADVIIVSNLTNKEITLYSFDNDSIHIKANAQDIPIHKKFEWRMPNTINVRRGDGGPVVSTNEEIEHKSNLEEAIKRAQARRGNTMGVDKIESTSAVKDVAPPKQATVDDDKATQLRSNTSTRGVEVLRPNNPNDNR